MFRHLILAAVVLAMAPAAFPQPPATPKTTDVLVMLSVKPGIARERVMGVMQDEIRATVRSYLDGKIRQWYSRADGKGVVFILAAGDVEQARAIMESLPLSKQNLVDLDYTALAPLSPLGLLLQPAPPAK
jgi:hypothetical protein